MRGLGMLILILTLIILLILAGCSSGIQIPKECEWSSIAQHALTSCPITKNTLDSLGQEEDVHQTGSIVKVKTTITCKDTNKNDDWCADVSPICNMPQLTYVTTTCVNACGESYQKSFWC